MPLEFTCTLLVGPPQIVIVGFPFPVSELLLNGSVTRIGVGEVTLTIAAVAVAFTVVAVGPNSFISVVLTLRVIVTWTTLTGSVVLSESVTPVVGVSNAL